jgi:hypothetical protein
LIRRIRSVISDTFATGRRTFAGNTVYNIADILNAGVIL